MTAARLRSDSDTLSEMLANDENSVGPGASSSIGQSKQSIPTFDFPRMQFGRCLIAFDSE